MYYIYIVTNPAKTVLYNNLRQRVEQHYANRGQSNTFAGRYYCYDLVYYESLPDAMAVITREKELKGWTRAKKDALIATMNPTWLSYNYNVWAPELGLRRGCRGRGRSFVLA